MNLDQILLHNSCLYQKLGNILALITLQLNHLHPQSISLVRDISLVKGHAQSLTSPLQSGCYITKLFLLYTIQTHVWRHQQHSQPLCAKQCPLKYCCSTSQFCRSSATQKGPLVGERVWSAKGNKRHTWPSSGSWTTVPLQQNSCIQRWHLIIFIP